MSPFEFTITLISIVIALGIARILGGYADLIQHRKETEHSWLFLIWFSFLLLTHVGWWFSLWGSSRDEVFSLSQFIILLNVPCFLFIATRLLIPSEGEFHKITKRYQTLRVPFLLAFSVAFLPGPMLRGFNTGDWSIALYLSTVGLLILASTLSPNMRLQYGVASIAGLV